MYTLTPETLIRIEGASDPKRGFFTVSWHYIVQKIPTVEVGAAMARMLFDTGKCEYLGRLYIHPDAITEVE